MKARALAALPTAKGFISAKIAIVLAILAAGGFLLVYEWRQTHASVKEHHVSVSAPKQHHKKKGGDKEGGKAAGKEGKSKGAGKAADKGTAGQ